jgi:hypothetical protein
VIQSSYLEVDEVLPLIDLSYEVISLTVGSSKLLAEGGVKTLGDKGIGESFKLG